MKFTISNVNVKRYAIEFISRLSFEDLYDVEIKKHKSNRSMSQNRLYWMWIGEIKKHVEESTGQIHSTDDIHEWLKAMFLEQKVISIGDIPQLARKSSANLTTSEFTEYLNKIDMYCADRLGLLLPKPDDLYFDAVYGKRK